MAERSLFTKSPVEAPRIAPKRLGWLRTPLLIAGCLGAGYGGSELHRYLNPTWTEAKAEDVPAELDHRKILVDIGDRYQLTNQRVNDQWRAILYLDADSKLQAERIAEMRELMGLDRPKPTPKVRPTASERLKPAPRVTPTPENTP